MFDERMPAGSRRTGRQGGRRSGAVRNGGGTSGSGFKFQVSSATEASPRQNALLVASRHPLVTIESSPIVEEHKRIFVRVDSPRPVALLALHVPNRESGTKWQFFDDVLCMLRAHAGEAALLVGDLNTGRQVVDEQGRFFNEQEDAWMRAIEETGWRDLYRARFGDAPAWSWHEPRGGHGFRLDHAFGTEPVAEVVRDIRYEWLVGGDGRKLSDHAAIVVGLGEGGEWLPGGGWQRGTPARMLAEQPHKDAGAPAMRAARAHGASTA